MSCVMDCCRIATTVSCFYCFEGMALGFCWYLWC